MDSGENASQTIMMRTAQESTANVFLSQECLDGRLLDRKMLMLLRHWRGKGVQNLNASMQRWRKRHLGPNLILEPNGNFFISTTRDLL